MKKSYKFFGRRRRIVGLYMVQWYSTQGKGVGPWSGRSLKSCGATWRRRSSPNTAKATRPTGWGISGPCWRTAGAAGGPGGGTQAGVCGGRLSRPGGGPVRPGGPRKTSARLLREDPALERWFTPEERETMAQAVEDHRASGGREPRSVYGKIVSEADRDIDPERIVQRVMAYADSATPSWGRRARYSGRWNTSGRSTGGGLPEAVAAQSPEPGGAGHPAEMARRRGAGGGVQAVWVRPYMCPTWTARCWTGKSGCRRLRGG